MSRRVKFEKVIQEEEWEQVSEEALERAGVDQINTKLQEKGLPANHVLDMPEDETDLRIIDTGTPVEHPTEVC